MRCNHLPSVSVPFLFSEINTLIRHSGLSLAFSLKQIGFHFLGCELRKSRRAGCRLFSWLIQQWIPEIELYGREIRRFARQTLHLVVNETISNGFAVSILSCHVRSTNLRFPESSR